MKKQEKNKKKKTLEDSLAKNLTDKKKPVDSEKKEGENSLSEKEMLKQSQERYIYLKAEFENFKKQSFKEKQDLARYASESFIISFVENVLDDLERALESNVDPTNLKEFQKGLEIILKKLHETLRRFGIEAIDPYGKPFDPTYQEALSREKTSKVAEGHVSITFKKAYKLHSKVIRPAQVVVAEKEEDS